MKGMTVRDLRVFRALSLYHMVGTNSKLVQWFNGEYKTAVGVLDSGWKLTSHAQTVFTWELLFLGAAHLMREASVPKWWEKAFAFACNGYYCGDDSVVAFDMSYWELFSSESVVDGARPDKLIRAIFDLTGVIIKEAETNLRVNEPGWEKFYSEVVDDKVVRPGVKFLQKYFVKVDENHNFLPPCAEDFFDVIPFSETSRYILRSGNDPKDWKRNEGDDVSAFIQKIIGLMYDAGYNKTAHYYLKACITICERANPGAFYTSVKATNLWEWRHKFTINDNNEFSELLSPYSYDYICSKYQTKYTASFLRRR